jgi:hypothetical protein
MSSIEPSPPPPGNTGPQSKIIAWTSFVADSRTSKVYSVANGGHSDYSGNEVDVLDLERDQPEWTERLEPTPSNQLTDCEAYYADGRPASRHTYYGATLDEFNDRIMLFGGALSCGGGGFFSPISSYNIGANAYSPSATHGDLPGAFQTISAYALNPSNGNVYACCNGAFGRWNPSSNTFTSLNPSGSHPAGYQTMSAFDTTRNRILFLGGDFNDHHLYTVSSNAWTMVTLSGANASDVSGAGAAAMVYVSAIDRYLVRLDQAGGTVYQVHPTTFEVTTFTTTGGGSVPSTENGPYNKFLYVPRLRGAVYVPAYDGNAWFLRIH